MRFGSVHNVTRDACLGTHILIADGWRARLRGYLGRREPEQHEGILLLPCSSIHMLGVRFALDVVFLDSEMRVLALHEAVQPGFSARSHPGAAATLELRAGRVRETHTAVGDVLEIQELGTHDAVLPAAASFKGDRP